MFNNNFGVAEQWQKAPGRPKRAPGILGDNLRSRVRFPTIPHFLQKGFTTLS